jgi:pachytene checkpoint protein 2
VKYADEVETLAVDRKQLSFEANPVDVHRATDAVLVQLDNLAIERPNLLFLATSNFPQALDAAFTSRCDLVLEIPPPGRQACEHILISCLEGLAEIFGPIGKLPGHPGFAQVADEVVGLDGRAIRKVVASALAIRKAVALQPELLTLEDLRQAARLAKAGRPLLKAA